MGAIDCLELNFVDEKIKKAGYSIILNLLFKRVKEI